MDKKWTVVGSLLVLLLLMSMKTAVLLAEENWDARYWNNTGLSGEPVLHRAEADLNYDWGRGSPHTSVHEDNFSARWQRTAYFDGGNYRFTATMDDGLRVWVDGQLIIDSWWDSQVHSMSADIYLSAGNHAVKVEYYEVGGDAVARVHWTRVPDVPGAIYNWRGEYFNNTYLGGAPVLVRDDYLINFDWGGSTPAWSIVPADQFSVRWTRSVSLPAGRYRFTTTSDDGVRLWVNNQLLIDKWFDQMPTQRWAEINLPGGPIPIKMEYYENLGGAVAQLSWLQVGSPPITQWRGEYFNNMHLVGSPILVRNDTAVNFNWGYESPAAGVNRDVFSARWTRDVTMEPGRYRFLATTDDGVRLWVNNQLIIDAWYDHAVQTFSGEIDLPGGKIPIKMEYCEDLGLAEAHLSWTRLDSPTTPGTGGPYTAFVNAYYLNVRQGPGVNYHIITTTSRNTAITLTHRNANASWVRVILPNGIHGWVSAAYLTSNLKPFTFLPISDETLPGTNGQSSLPMARVVNAYYLNVRRGPGIIHGVVTVIARGQQVTLAGYRNSNATWVKIRLADGREGWVNAYYLSSTYPFSNLVVGGW